MTMMMTVLAALVVVKVTGVMMVMLLFLLVVTVVVEFFLVGMILKIALYLFLNWLYRSVHYASLKFHIILEAKIMSCLCLERVEENEPCILSELIFLVHNEPGTRALTSKHGIPAV